ncbi:hypothetical protein HPB48_003992 [Haemaphysalis longicornis]|uniref:Gustatory receptor n=1 Tax=Haemaphysalis longicornis TaxID=44386 RepID=A0A9J6G6G6_HAELO|nr:hypothetical protein HPB48_003992 [Haemaphysalis longicornis]
MAPDSQPTAEATLRQGSHMIRRFWKYGLLFRFFGFFFIEGFQDRSLRRAKVKFLTPYILCATAWFTCGIGFEAAYLGGRTFLKSNSVRSYTKSLLFIVHSSVAVKCFFNILCLAVGTSKLLEFFRESAAYERSICYVPLVDAHSRKQKLLGAARSTLGLVVFGACYAVTTDSYVTHIVGDYGEEWRVVMTIWANLSMASFFVYDSLLHIILTRTSDVLADYLHCQVMAFSTVLEKATHRQCDPEASLRVQEIRVHVSEIRRLVRFINNIWHSALVASAASLTFLLCVTFYALLNDGLAQRAVRVAFSYSLFCLYQFIDIVAVSQTLVDEVRHFTYSLRYSFLDLEVKTTNNFKFDRCLFQLVT